MPILAVSFDVFSPYTIARLNALGIYDNLIGIESAFHSVEYDWDKCIGVENFRRLTLFETGTFEGRRAQEIRARISEKLAELKPDAMVINGWSQPTALALLAWSLDRQVPVVVMSESTEFDAQRVWWKEALKRRVVRLCSAALVGGTPHQSYIQKLGMPPDCIFTGYDVVDNDYFAAGAAQARQNSTALRRDLGLPDNYFLSTARFITKKNLPRLLRAYARYRDAAEEPAWKFVLLGDGPMRPELEALAKQLGIDHDLVMPGFKQYGELPAYYGLAKAFVHASTVEQWGLVVNEAMAGGLPVLVSNRCGCAADLVAEGKNGHTFDPYDVDGLAKLLLKISSDQNGLAEMGRASEEIISHWTPADFTVNMIDACQAAIARGPGKANFIDRVLLRFRNIF